MFLMSLAQPGRAVHEAGLPAGFRGLGLRVGCLTRTWVSVPRPLSYRKCGWGRGGMCHRRKGECLQCTPNLTWGRAGQCGH